LVAILLNVVAILLNLVAILLNVRNGLKGVAGF
jgi:hypothetical protein